MATPVEVPKLGNSVEECLITRWVKQQGDAVAEGETVAEIETDKATFEVPTPVDGVLLATFFAEGVLVPVFTNLFVVGDAGEDVEAFRPQEPESVDDSPAAETAAVSAPSQRRPTPESTAAPVSAGPSAAFSPRARRFAEQHDFRPGAVEGSGPNGRVLEEDLRREYYASPRASAAAKDGIAEGRRAPAEGSGVGGMILRSDLGPTPEPISNTRKNIARRMRESLTSTAQYTLHSSADATGLLALRARVKASSGTTPDININDLVAFCTLRALAETPDLNAELIDGALYRYEDVHLGVAVDTPRGLLAPVVRDASKLTIADLAIRMKELARQAAEGTIAADDLSGATFTVSNLGGLGVEAFTPLINPPQVAILGVNAIRLQPVRRDGKVEFIDAIGFSLTCDHQVVDGAPGARFLQILKAKIENVESLCTI